MMFADGLFAFSVRFGAGGEDGGRVHHIGILSRTSKIPLQLSKDVMVEKLYRVDSVLTSTA